MGFAGGLFRLTAVSRAFAMKGSCQARGYFNRMSLIARMKSAMVMCTISIRDALARDCAGGVLRRFMRPTSHCLRREVRPLKKVRPACLFSSGSFVLELSK
jgi:hypothetical protein